MYWLTTLVGVLFAAAPFVLGYDNNQPALWTSLLVGAGVVVLSAFEAAEKDRDLMEYWLAAILGVGAIAAPFLLNYDGNSSAMWTSIVAGSLIGIVALSRIFFKQTALTG